MDASALVVGIDNYTDLPKLSGCTADALEAVEWLTAISVPPGRIRLHVASTEAVNPPDGIVHFHKSAERDAIWRSILQIKEETGERLFVFLSGHGYYLSETGPIFLAQDWSSGFSSKNLDIRRYADYFQGLKFNETMFVFDACQNLDTDPVYRSGIQPSGPDDKTILPDPHHGVVLCCAAAQGQYAPIVDGRGLLTRKLLKELRAAPEGIPPLARDAYVYDWDTGAAKLDLGPLYKHVVAPWVTDVAAKGGHTLTPTVVPYGRLQAEHRWIVRDLPALATVPLRVVAEPLQGLDSITVRLRPAARELELPPVPFQGVVPAGRDLIAHCTPAAGWEAVPPTANITPITVGIDLRFDLRERPPDPERDSFNVKIIDGTGGDSYQLSREDYLEIGVDTDAPPTSVPGTPQITHHENGPDIARNDASLEATEALTRQVRHVLFDRVSGRVPDVEFVIVPPGLDWKRSRPNLRLLLPDGGAPALVGYLGPEPLIRIERVGRGGAEPIKRFPADDLARHAWLRLDPAQYRIVVDAPWGLASVLVDLDEKPLVARVPIPVGLPPLRNAFIRRARGEHLSPGSFQGGWPSMSLGSLVGAELVPRPPGLLLLTSRLGDQLRAEPFSDLPWEEWDMLLGAGRLDAINLDAAARRVASAKGKRFDLDVLRLALAYAAWAQRKPDLIETFLSELSPDYRQAPDALLLRLEAEDSSTSQGVPPPYFRWGVQLLARRAPAAVLPSAPSPYSVWSVYQYVTGPETEPESQPQAGTIASKGDRGAVGGLKESLSWSTKREETPESLTPYGHWWLEQFDGSGGEGHGIARLSRSAELGVIELESRPGGRLEGHFRPTPPEQLEALAAGKTADDGVFGKQTRAPFLLRRDSIVGDRKEEPQWTDLRPPGTVIVGIIDDGIAFANERFRLTNGETRFDYLWLQGAALRGPTDLPFGRELEREEINDLLAKHRLPSGEVDEESLYRDAGLIDMAAPEYQSAAQFVSHGTAVLDTAAGYAPGDPAAEHVTIIGIGLPIPIIQDTSGSFLDRFVMLGIDRILLRVEELERANEVKTPYPVIINTSFALTAGPEGRQHADRPLHAELPQGAAGSRVHPASGNDRQSRVRARLAAGQRLTWRTLPDDRTSSFLEIWMEPRHDSEPPTVPQVTCALAPPGLETPVLPSAAPAIGGYVNFGADDSPTARAYYEWHPFDPAKPGYGRERIVVALPPTVADYPGQHYGPPGDWRIELSGPGTGDLFIQRDDTLFGGTTRGRQSYFVDGSYEDYDDSGRPIEVDDGTGFVTRLGTITSFALSDEAVVVGAKDATGEPMPYSGLGQESREIRDPTEYQVADDSRVHEGILAAGTFSGSTVVISGTSVAAPKACRTRVEEELLARLGLPRGAGDGRPDRIDRCGPTPAG